jgi:DNA-binding PadR family transcriptional regulator
MEAEMLKGHLDAIVLAALEGGPAHGYAIIEAIKNRSDGTFDLPEGTIYPALHRLEQAGLLSSAWTTPPSGRRRRVYALTKSGASRLADGRKAWTRFAKAVDSSIGGGRAWPA